MLRFRNWRRQATAAAAAVSFLAAGCGGGGGAAPAGEDAPSATVLTGTAAIGAALVGGQVEVRDSTGQAACTDASSLTTNASGEYRCVLRDGAQAPFVVVVTDPEGLINPMVSLIAQAPAEGSTSTANVSRLTTAIATLLAPSSDPFAFVNDSAKLAALDPATLDAVKTNVVTQLADVLADIGLDPATFDPISTPFVGGSNTGADKLLDQVTVVFENGTPMLANLLNPDAAPVAMADAETSNPPPVAKSAVDAAFSMAELDFAKTAMEACFAVPTAERDGSDACTGFVVDDAPAAATGGATYLHSGFDADSAFGPLLASDDMHGAQFNRPELVRYIPVNDGRDEAVINVKFRDRNGVPDNRIIVVKKFPGTSTASRPTNWWFYGNQRNLNIYVRAAIRQQEQMIPEASLAAFGAGASRYVTGLDIFIARPCANTTFVCPNSAGIRYVRVKGPGLPTAGLVYADVGSLPQSWMAILNADGTIPSGEQQTVNSSSNIFWLQRSRAISGEGAFQVRPNPSVGTATPGFNNWAHPAMYGETPSSTWSFDLSRVPAWSEYRFEVFRGTDTTTTEVYTTRLVTPVVPAVYAATQQWHSFPAATRALASDGAPAASSLEMAWTPNPYAERVASVQAYSFSAAGGNVNSPSTGVLKGASTQTVTASDGGQFGPLSLSTTDINRFLQWRYRMLDGSYKDQTLTFN